MFSESVALVVRNANLHGELSEAKSFLENLIQSATESIVAVDPVGPRRHVESRGGASVRPERRRGARQAPW